MSTVEIVAKHAIVSDTCRANRTTEGAIDEALDRLRDEAVALMARRGEGRGDLFHFKLSIERVTGSAGNAGVQTARQPQHAPICKSVSECPNWDHCRAVGECCPPEPEPSREGFGKVELPQPTPGAKRIAGVRAPDGSQP